MEQSLVWPSLFCHQLSQFREQGWLDAKRN